MGWLLLIIQQVIYAKQSVLFISALQLLQRHDTPHRFYIYRNLFYETSDINVENYMNFTFFHEILSEEDLKCFVSIRTHSLEVGENKYLSSV